MKMCIYAGYKECNKCNLCGVLFQKKIKIKCPGCGVVYEVDRLEGKPVKCQRCGAEYLQAIHNVDNPEFIRAAAYRCRGSADVLTVLAGLAIWYIGIPLGLVVLSVLGLIVYAGISCCLKDSKKVGKNGKK